MSTESVAGTGYIREMQVARGVGILLVTFGHSEPVAEVFPTAWAVVYSFHMPLFFFMSGFFSQRLIHRSWLADIVPQTSKFLLPYAVISLAFAAIKLVAPQVKRQVVPSQLLSDIFLYPFNNPALYLWFLYVLLLMRFVSPVFRGKGALLLLPVALAGACWPGSIEIFGLWSFCKHLVYFLAGILLSSASGRFLGLLRDLRLGLLALTVFVLVTVYGGIQQTGPLSVIAALSGIWCVLVLSSLPMPQRFSAMLEYCGKVSLEIYLLQYFIIFPLLYVLLRAGMDHALIVLCTFTAGLLGPILMEKHVLQKSRLLALLLSGRSAAGVR